MPFHKGQHNGHVMVDKVVQTNVVRQFLVYHHIYVTSNALFYELVQM